MTTVEETVAGNADLHGRRTLLVRQVTWEAEGVLSLRLTDPDGGLLPEWQPGAHVDLVLPSGRVRQYSLCGDPADRRAYTIAVRDEPDGRGGSREIHSSALAGRLVDVQGPRNHFALVPAPRYLFIAGGIGITPILPMVRRVHAWGVPWRLVYGGRSRQSMPFAGDLAELADRAASRVDMVPEDECGVPDLDAILADLADGTRVYCCGPEGLLRAVEQRCENRPRGVELHVERFSAVPGRQETPGEATVGGDAVPGGPPGTFEVELRRTGVTLTVQPDRTLIDVVREAVPDLLSSCEEGFCGTCETKVLDGTPDHHDTILSARERESGRTMMICVGRSRSRRLVLDL
ncbi:PDR/VanB family oxidoreductase [Prauserella muralis]|uniref:Ferredoxin n=1 Tax=Prauserella muralis TaxID=588067 RepID=A0A2V4B2L5_9PSEU|nr:ferredoxin [Prauserella muralis]TWE22325.1 ferredoxin-NADP reductase [Prauserella muralis]